MSAALVEVTQAARDAAARLVGLPANPADVDADPAVQAFARAINEAELRGARLMKEGAWEAVRFADVPVSELIKRKFAKEIRALDPATIISRATLTEIANDR